MIIIFIQETTRTTKRPITKNPYAGQPTTVVEPAYTPTAENIGYMYDEEEDLDTVYAPDSEVKGM